MTSNLSIVMVSIPSNSFGVGAQYGLSGIQNVESRESRFSILASVRGFGKRPRSSSRECSRV